MISGISDYYSQTLYVRKRQEAGLHVIDEVKRFRMLACVLMCSICVSLVFAFDLFTTNFSENFGLNAKDLSTISTVGVVCCYFALPYGILYDYIGPVPLLCLAFVFGTVGCLGLALIFDGKITGNTATIAIFYAFMNACSGLFDGASIVTLVETFPRNRGPVVGIAKVMTGLGSSVLASVSNNFFPDNISGFIYCIMALVMLVSLVGMALVVLPPYFVNGWRRRGKSMDEIAALESLKVLYHQKNVPLRRIGVGYVIVTALIVFFAISSPVVAYVEVSTEAKYALGSIALALCASYWIMALPIQWLGGVNEPADDETMMLMVLDGKAEAAKFGGVELDGADDDVAALVEPSSQSTAEAAAAATTAAVHDEEGPQDPRYEGNIWHIISQPDIWLLLIAFVCQGAIGIIVTYNASTIYVARTGNDRSAGLAGLYTAFLGVGSAVGRIAMGLFEAYVQSQPADNRRYLVSMALPVAPVIGAIAGILILVLPGEALLFPYILVYFEEGVFNGVRALIFPCLFAENHGILYNMSFTTTVVCVIGFNRFLFGTIVEEKRKKLGYADAGDINCRSKECVQTPMIVVTCTAAVAAVLATVVHLRYSKFVSVQRELRAKAAAVAQPSASEPVAMLDGAESGDLKA